MKNTQRLLLGLTLVSLFSFAFAQDVQGIPAEYQTMITVVVGLLSSILVQPLTAIAKKLGRTQGPTTVVISAALSLLIAYGFAVSQALATGERVPFWSALIIALIAFLKANGDYLTRVFTSARGNEVTPPTPADGGTALPLDKNTEGSGLEPMPLDGAQGFLTLPTMQHLLDDTTLMGVIKAALGVAGIEVTDDRVLKVAMRVLKLAPDLLDGNLHLSAETRGLVLNAVMDLKEGKVL